MPYKDPEKAKEFRRKYYLENREKKIKQAHDYYYSHYEKRKEQKRLWAERNKEFLKIYRKNYYRNVYGKHKSKATQIVFNLIKEGKLIKPKQCSECKSINRIQGHHEDYNNPTRVIWLCHVCHKKQHRIKKESEK